MPIDWENLPAFDKLSKCVKCGFEIQQPVPAPTPEPGPPSNKDGSKPPAKKPAATAAAAPPPMVMPVTAPNPTVAYCNGEACPWGEPGEAVPEHMHQFCDCCGYEWVSTPLG